MVVVVAMVAAVRQQNPDAAGLCESTYVGVWFVVVAVVVAAAAGAVCPQSQSCDAARVCMGWVCVCLPW